MYGLIRRWLSAVLSTLNGRVAPASQTLVSRGLAVAGVFCMLGLLMSCGGLQRPHDTATQIVFTPRGLTSWVSWNRVAVHFLSRTDPHPRGRGGKGSFSMDFSHYDVMPGNVQQEIISKATLHEEEEE